MKDKPKRIIEILALLVAFSSLVISIIANNYAKEANEISKDLIPSRLVVVDSSVSGGSSIGSERHYQSERNVYFLLKNLGNKDVNIIGFKTRISFASNSKLVVSQTNTISKSMSQLPNMQYVSIRLLNDEYKGVSQLKTEPQPPYSLLQEMPFTIKAGESYEVYSLLYIVFFGFDVYGYSGTTYYREGYSPLEATYIFILENSEEIQTPTLNLGFYEY